MPGRFYLTTEILSDGSEADFFFLDTTPIVEAGTRRTADATQIAWLQRELAGSTARWKVVVGHHPVFSGGRHGNDPAMIAHVKPLLERYGVSAYLAGHDHDLEHFAAGGVHYLTCGTGAETRSVRAIQGSLFVASRLGFLRARLDPTALHIAFVGTDGKNLHEAAIAPAS